MKQSDLCSKLQGLSPQALAALAIEVKAKLQENRLADYQPYPKQQDFHDAGGDEGVRERLLIAGNQLGKCVSGRTLIDHPDGTATPASELYESGRPFKVMAWDGEKAVIADAVHPIRKLAEPLVRLWLDDGRWIECSLMHRVLCQSGEYCFVGMLLPSLPALPACDLGFGL